jgi:hypothetical protein
MADIKDFDKDQLAAFALSEFKVELDCRKSIGQLRAEVVKLQNKPKEAVEEKLVSTPSQPTHILNRTNGMWFPWTGLLQQHLTNAVPCDENGNPV